MTAGVGANAGIGPAVVGPALAPSTAPSPGKQWGAPVYDLATRQILQNADGSFPSMHPVDVQVLIALGVKLGSIPSKPTAGSGNSALRQDSKAAAALTNDVTVALSALVKRGDIRVVGVTIDMSIQGRTIRSVDYLNLRLPNPVKQSVTQ